MNHSYSSSESLTDAGLSTPVHTMDETSIAFKEEHLHEQVEGIELSKEQNTTILLPSSQGKDWNRVQDIVQTVTYFIVFIFFGFSNALIGPTLGNLALNTNSQMKQMGWIFTCKGLGGIIGSMIGGKGYDYFKARSMRAAHIFLVASIAVMAVCLSLVPLLPNLWSLLILYVVFGCSVGLVNMGVNLLCMWTWKEKVTPIILALSCIAGVGSFLGPLFLSTGIRFQFAYWITGAMVAASAVVLLLGQLPSILIVQNSQQQATTSESSVDINDQVKLEPLQISRNNDWRTNWKALLTRSRDIRISIIVGMALFGCVGLESSFGGLANTYFEKKHLAANPQQSSLMISGFWISLTAARLVTSLISSFVKPAFLLTANVILCFASIALFIILSKTTTIIWIWIAIVLMGVGISSQFPSALSYPETSMNGVHVTGKMSSVMIVIASAAEMTIPVIATQLFDSIGPDSLFWILLLVCALSAIAYTILFVWSAAINKKKSDPSIIDPYIIDNVELKAIDENNIVNI
jgi:MFS family permease